jgi:hypothetical protein
MHKALVRSVLIQKCFQPRNRLLLVEAFFCLRIVVLFDLLIITD